MFSNLLDFFFPRRSLLGIEGEWLTEEERRMLVVHPYGEWTDNLRARGVVSLDHLVAACTYKKQGLIQKAIHTFKYKRIKTLYSDFAKMIAQSANGVGRPSDLTVCPVPLHWTRKFTRGFNQAELLARAVAARTRSPYQELLKRTRPTGHQAWRTREQRLHALCNAFEVIGTDIPKRVVLIDDLATTGATLDECARVLKEAGVEWVEAWVVAQG